jgi:putative oxidoreductase
MSTTHIIKLARELPHVTPTDEVKDPGTMQLQAMIPNRVLHLVQASDGGSFRLLRIRRTDVIGVRLVDCKMHAGVLCHKISTSTKEASMSLFQRFAFAAARVLIALVFLANGFGIIPQSQPAKELASHGTPAALVPMLMLTARTIEIVGGFALILGIYPQIAAIAIIVFLVPATLLAHDFWRAVGTPEYVSQLLQFLKNTAITGGLVIIAATSNQPTLVPRNSQSMDR